MKVFVLGGNGSVGLAFAKIASTEFGEVILLDVKESDCTQFRSVNVDCLDVAELGKLILTEKPDIVVNSINIATIFSKVPTEANRESILFHLGLYSALSKLGKKVSYLQIGTLGTGGLGFSVPFTHGEHRDDLPLFNKAALAGVTTSMLVLLARSLKESRISEIIPGLSIFNTQVLESEYSGCSLVLVDGGENGYYTYNELGILTAFMGLTTPERIAAEAMAVLKGESSDGSALTHDAIKSVNSSVIEENDADRAVRAGILKDMRSRQGDCFIVATSNLGPPSLTRDLILATLIKANEISDEAGFVQALQANSSVKATLQYIHETNPSCGEYLNRVVNYQNYLDLKPFATDGEPWETVRRKLSAIEA